MSEKTGLREDLRSEVEALAASDAPDEEVLNEVVRRVHVAHPVWDWSGIYLLVGIPSCWVSARRRPITPASG